MYRNRTIAIAVPAYNESGLISQTIESIPDFVDRIFAVDDASTDSTYDIITHIPDDRILPLRHRMNGGVGAAVATAYKHALMENVDITVVMAGDNQMDPLYLSALLDPIVDDRAEFSKGNRLVSAEFRKGMSPWRLLGNTVLTYLTKVASGYWNIEDPQNGYTAISISALRLIDLDTVYKGFAFENDMLVRLNVHNARVVNVPIPARYGQEKSKIRYVPFIMRTSGYLLRACAWRIDRKFIQSGKGKTSSHIGQKDEEVT